MWIDHLIDPDAAEAAVTNRTRALLPVQLNGRTADMNRLSEVARRYGLTIVEDAAQGVGSKFQGKAAGTFWRCRDIQFLPGKNARLFWGRRRSGHE